MAERDLRRRHALALANGMSQAALLRRPDGGAPPISRASTHLALTLPLLAGLVPGAPASAQQQQIASLDGSDVTLAGTAASAADTATAGGTMLLPVGQNLGLQLDGTAGHAGAEAIWRVNGHAFWRESSQDLLGLTAGWTETGTQQAHRAALEGELHFGDAVTAARWGYRFGSTGEGAFAQLELGWFADANTYFWAGGEYAPHGSYVGHLRSEIRPGIELLPGLSLFAQSDAGTNDYYGVVGGLQYCFGPLKAPPAANRGGHPISVLDSAAMGQRWTAAAFRGDE